MEITIEDFGMEEDKPPVTYYDQSYGAGTLYYTDYIATNWTLSTTSNTNITYQSISSNSSCNWYYMEEIK